MTLERIVAFVMTGVLTIGVATLLTIATLSRLDGRGRHRKTKQD